jgi:hypothetical protein
LGKVEKEREKTLEILLLAAQDVTLHGLHETGRLHSKSFSKIKNSG